MKLNSMAAKYYFIGRAASGDQIDSMVETDVYYVPVRPIDRRIVDLDENTEYIRVETDGGPHIECTEFTCESHNHQVPQQCYGILWKCECCGRILCCNEGADDDHFELCDDCALQNEKGRTNVT